MLVQSGEGGGSAAVSHLLVGVREELLWWLLGDDLI